MQPIVDLILPSAFFRTGPLVTQDGRELTTADKVEIMQTACRFDWCYLAHNRDGLAHILTDDVVFDHAMITAVGKEDVLKVGDIAALSYGLRHIFTNQIVFVSESGHAACASYALVVKLASEQPLDLPMPLLLDHAIVFDDLRFEDGLWKICKRTTEQQKFTDAQPLPDKTRRAMELTSAQRLAETAA